MSVDATPTVVVAGLTHDLVRRRSLVLLTWTTDPEKRVSLEVPFGCSLEILPAEAEKALRALSAETATLPVRAADREA